MRAYHCSRCGQLLFFDNSVCLGCGSEVGFDAAVLVLRLVRTTDARCGAATIAGCNWLVDADGGAERCLSCRLTRTRPSDEDTEALAAFAVAERAKRQLVYQLLSMGLPVIDRDTDADGGLAFDLLSSRDGPVTTGHAGGVITLDLAESDSLHREAVRLQLGEPYRTVLGHLRHEIAHYYWPLLVEARPVLLEEFRERFGDEREPYDVALRRHYDEGAPQDWSIGHVSEYATMHPWEDWAETFAHLLHIRAGIETAAAFGLQGSVRTRDAARRSLDDGVPDTGANELVERWLNITFTLNAMARALGQEPLYPFVLTPTVVEKLDFVRRAIDDATAAARGEPPQVANADST